VGAGPGEKKDEQIISLREAPRTVAYPHCYIVHNRRMEEGLSFPLGTDVLPKQTWAETYEYMEEYLR
jgi:hypothetical protein